MLFSWSVLGFSSDSCSLWFLSQSRCVQKAIVSLLVSIQIVRLRCCIGYMTCTDCSPLTPFKEKKGRWGLDTGSSSEPQFKIDFLFQRCFNGPQVFSMKINEARWITTSNTMQISDFRVFWDETCINWFLWVITVDVTAALQLRFGWRRFLSRW